MLRHNKKQDDGISEEELKSCTCPISNSLFLLPIKTECGHIFEDDKICAWLGKTRSKCPVDDCEFVLDRNKLSINSIDWAMYKKVSRIIERDPKLAARQHFSFSLFTHIIQLPSPTISDHYTLWLNDMVRILEENSGILNNIDPKQGFSPLFVLTNNDIRGHDILAAHPKLRKNITWEGLNAPCQADHLKNLTPLLMLLRGQSKGFEILARDPVLRQKIDPKALGLTAECKEHEGKFPLLNLMGCPEGIRFLRECPDIIDIISPEALNMISPLGKYKGISPVLALAGHPEGIDLLSDFPQLRHKIRSSALEATSESKEAYEGLSPLFVFCATPKGRKLLGLDEEFFINMMTPKGLNAICMVGPHKGTSPVYFLIANVYGRELLCKFPKLRRMITLAALRTTKQNGDTDSGTFPLLVLVSYGASLLNQARDLRQIITADALLQTCETGINSGKSPYSELKEHNIELLIKILKENIFLQADLSNRISAEDRQFFKRRGISFPSGRQLGEFKQDSGTSSIIQNLKINWDDEEHLQFWSRQTSTCFHGYGGVEVTHRATGNKYRVPTRIHKMLQIAAAKDEYKTPELFSEAISQAGSQKPSFWNNPFSWMTRAEKTDQLYTQDSKNIASFKI